jgi:hypothetical protein
MSACLTTEIRQRQYYQSGSSAYVQHDMGGIRDKAIS